MQRLQAYQFELIPNGQQALLMRRFAGACRFVFNKALALQQSNHADGGKYIGYVEMAKRLTAWRNSQETPWLKDAPAHPLQHALKDLDRAYLLQSKRRRVLFIHEWPDGHGLRDAKSFATFSDGSFLAPLNSFRQHEQRLARYQRRMARKVKGSKNWNKAKKKVQRIHAEIANVRKDFLHKATTAISQQYALVVLEDLKVRNMSKSAKGNAESPGKKVRAKSGLNKSILDQGWYEFRRQLEYKMQWQGGWLMTVNPRNTSRTCPVCGHVSADNRTTQAKFACVSCGHQAHADVVGAINILARGMQNMRHGGKDMPPNACIESFVSSPCEETEETTCTYDLVCPEGHAKESQGFPLRGNRDSSHGGDVSHAKLARVKHASPMKQEPTEVILQDE